MEGMQSLGRGRGRENPIESETGTEGVGGRRGKGRGRRGGTRGRLAALLGIDA